MYNMPDSLISCVFDFLFINVNTYLKEIKHVNVYSNCAICEINITQHLKKIKAFSSLLICFSFFFI